MNRTRKCREEALRPATLSHYFEYFWILFALTLIRCVPGRFHAFTARLISLYWHFIFPLRRGVALENLRQAFPEKTEAWRRLTARQCVAHFFQMMGFEFTQMRTGQPENIAALIDRIEGMEHYESACGDQNPGIFVSGHLGNWELFISAFARLRNRSSVALAKPMHNPLTENLIARTRAACGWKVIYTYDNPARSILRAVRECQMIAFLADQDARSQGVFVPFFGKPASTARGPALFAWRSNLPLVFGAATRSPDTGRYRLRFYPPLLPDRTASLDDEIERLTAAHTALLEQAIREAPEQYFWFHRRWKTQPKNHTSQPMKTPNAEGR